MSENCRFETDIVDGENLMSRIRVIQKCQADLAGGLQNDNLAAQGMEISRKFVIRGYENGIVPAYHQRILLVPKAREPIVHGIEKLIVAFPVYVDAPYNTVPTPLIESAGDADREQESNGLRTGNDLFVEVFGSEGQSAGYYLVNPEGTYIYHDALEVVPAHGVIDDENVPVFDHLFTVMGEASQMPVEFEWGLFEALSSYELTLQDNTSRTA